MACSAWIGLSNAAAFDTTASSAAARATAEPARRLAVGAAVTGGQLRYGVDDAWSFELRYLAGKARSQTSGDVKSSVTGLRAYRHAPWRPRLRLFAGAETAYASIKTVSAASDQSASGYLVGAFAGFEYRLLGRLSLALDAGPYVVSLKDRATGRASRDLDFVLNTGLYFYLF